jgi:hypothetical protein
MFMGLQKAGCPQNPSRNAREENNGMSLQHVVVKEWELKCVTKM